MYPKPTPRPKKRASQERRYNKAAKEWIEGRFCICGAPAQQVHHKAGRLGDLLLDESLWLAVCGYCHHNIETRPKWAKENGYSISRIKPLNK